MAQVPEITHRFEEFFRLAVRRGTAQARDHALWYHGRQRPDLADYADSICLYIADFGAEYSLDVWIVP